MMENMDWKSKAEKFLKSHLNDDNTNAEEAAVYFLSRRKKNKNVLNTINNSLERWRDDKTRWDEKSLHNHFKAASILRLIQWGEIGTLKEFRDNICGNLDMPNSHEFYGCFSLNTAAFFPLIFPLFTSDLAVNRMSSKLNFMLHQWQYFLRNLFMKTAASTYSINTGKYSIPAGQTVNTLASAYVFGAYRLHYGDIDNKILDKSVQIILDSQLDTGIWGYDTTGPDSEEDDYSFLGDYVNSRKHVVLVAMCIHALYVAQPFGAKICIAKAGEWLLKQQQPDGGWYQLGDPKYSNQVHTTVLVLDALGIAFKAEKTHPRITYKREQKDEDHYNVKYPKKKKQKRSLPDNKAKQQNLIIQRLRNSVFIIENDNTISLAYDGIKKNMRLKESHALNLILFLCKAKRLTSKELKSILQSNNTPTKIVRDINGALVNWINDTNLIKLPNYVEIIDYDEEIGIYYSRIQIATKDQYEEQSLKNSEEIVYDPLENSEPED